MDFAFEVVSALLFGLAIGSFLNVCIARMPHEESVITPRSRCPKCRKPIAAYDNIPVLSWILLQGRCRTCAEPISIRYPAVEALTGALSALIAWKYGGLGIPWAMFLAFSCAMIVLAFIDIDHRILPSVITLNGIWIGLVMSVIYVRPSPIAWWFLRRFGFDDVQPRVVSFVACALGAIVGSGMLWVVGEAFLRIKGIEGLGQGDVKMMATVGAFLGLPLTLFTILVGSCLGSIIGILFIRLTGKSRQYELPYGTFLAFGAVLAVVAGNELTDLYLRWAFPARL